MRVVAFVLTVVGVTALTVLAMLGMVRLSQPGDTTWLPLAGAGVALALYGPLLLGTLAAWWELRESSDSGRHYRLWRNVAASATLLGMALVVAGGLLSGAPWWLLAAVAVAAALLLLVAVPVGTRVRLSADASGPRASDAFRADTAVDSRRTVLRTALTFAVTLVVAAGAWIALAVTRDEPVDLRVGLLFMAFPFVISSVVCLLSAQRLNRRVREVTGRDFGRLRALTRVVLKGADDPLDEEGRIAAVRYAALAPALLVTQIGGQLLLFVGLALQITSQALGGWVPRTLAVVGLGVMAVLLAVVIPMTVIRARRARAYASRHRELLIDT